MHRLPVIALIFLFSLAPLEAGEQLLEDFEEANSLDNWQLTETQAELVAGHATRGAQAARLVFGERSGEGSRPEAVLRIGRRLLPNNEWLGYDRLAFDVYNPGGKVIDLRVGLYDSTARVANGVFSIEGGSRMTCEIPVARIYSKVAPVRVELTERVRRRSQHTLELHLGASRSEMILDNVRLVADSLRIESAELGLDPLGGGRVKVEAAANHGVRFDLRIVDSAGRAVARRSEETHIFRWAWDDPLELATLSPGTYRALLTITDFKWQPDSPVERELGSFEVAPEAKRPELVAWYRRATEKVMLDSRPVKGEPLIVITPQGQTGSKAEPLKIEMARNEFEGAQVVFLASRPVRIGCRIGELRHEKSGAAFPLEGSQALQVGYLKTEDPVRYQVDFIGWWPDALLPVDQMYAEPAECMPVWINLRSTAATEPGTYRGKLSLWINGEPGGEIPLEVRVYDVTLPVETTLRTAFTFSDEHLADLYGGKLPEGMLRRYHQLLADHRLNVDNIYRNTPPDLETVEYFAKKGQLNAFNLKYIGGRVENVANFDNEAYLDSLAAMFDPYVDQLRKRGLVHLAYFYGFDEVGGEMFKIIKRTFGFLKQRYPEIPTMTTGYDASYGVDSGLLDEVDIWVPLTPVYDLARAEAARRRWKEVWWYICISPPHPYANWFIEYPAIEARLLWWMTYQQKVPGFLYYFTNLRQNQNQLLHLTGHNQTDWDPASYQTANGDGCFIYSAAEGPVSTIRFENIRDGIEDTELLFLLEKRLNDGGSRSRAYCGELFNSLTDFTLDTAGFASVRARLLAELEKISGK